jgi:hypothetical protein
LNVEHVMSDETEQNPIAAAVVEAVQRAYAAEEDAVAAFYEERTDTGWFGVAVGFIPYVGDLLSPSSTSPDPPGFELGAGFVAQRANAAVARIEAAVGFVLDEETKTNIGEDVRAIWYCETQ